MTSPVPAQESVSDHGATSSTQLKMADQYIETRNVKEQYQRALARFQADDQVSDHNKELLSRFLRDASLGKTVLRRAKKRIGPARLLGYITQLYPLLLFVDKDLDQVTQENMELFIEALDVDRIRSRMPQHNGAIAPPLSERYKVDVRVTVRQFYKWLLGDCRMYPPLVEWIETFAEPAEVTPLTESEIDQMLDHARSPMHRAIVQTLFDGGFRIGELLNIRLKHVQKLAFDPQNPRDPSRQCFFVRVPFSKTLPRTVGLPMPMSTRTLGTWLSYHRQRPRIREDGSLEASDVEAPLFPLTDNSVRLLIRRLGRQALNKRVYPHLLRHTSATYWANKLPYFKFCKRFGWTMTSRMPQRYIDRAGVDEMDVAMLYHRSQTQAGSQTAIPHSQDGALASLSRS